MNLIAFNASSIGASHIRIGKECQDYSLSDVGDDWCIAVTCDGHGGDNYFRSSLGSRFAAETAMRCIGEFLKKALLPDGMSACGAISAKTHSLKKS